MKIVARLHRGGRRRVMIGALLAAAGLALAGCGGADPAGAAGDEFHVLALLATSGLAAPAGTVLEQGATAAVEVANAAGGVDGRRVVMTVVDTQSDPSRAISALRKAIATDRPDLVFSGSSSTEVVALLPAVTQERMPFVTNTVATDVGIGGANPYSFSAVAGEIPQSKHFADLLRSTGHRTVGFVYPDTPAGTTAATTFSDVLGRAGLVVRPESYAANALEMNPQLERLRDVDAVVFWSVGPAGGYIIKSRALVGMHTPFYGNTAVTNANVFSVITPEEGEGVWLNTFGANLAEPESKWTQGKRDMLAQFGRTGVKPVTGVATYAFGYDAIMLGLNGAATATDPADAGSWAAAMIAQADGPFAPAISAKPTGWTAQDRFRQEMGGYIQVPAATPLVDGMFTVDRTGAAR